MSAYVVEKEHIDALITAGLHFARPGSPLRWQARELTEADRDAAYQRGEPWGPRACELARELRRELTEETAGRVGAMLWAENQRSVNHRYDEEEWEPVYLFDRLPGRPEPVIVLRLLACYEYQTCEHPDWKGSEAYRFCDALRDAAIRALPGYEDAPWGASDRGVFLPKPEPEPEPEPPREHLSRDEAIARIRKALKERSGKAWSVKGGRGTAWGWIEIDAPPKRRTWHYRETGTTDERGMPAYEEYEDAARDFGHTSPEERAELAALLGLDKMHHQGVSIPSGGDYYEEYVARAEGRTPTRHGVPYWD